MSSAYKRKRMYFPKADSSGSMYSVLKIKWCLRWNLGVHHRRPNSKGKAQQTLTIFEVSTCTTLRHLTAKIKVVNVTIKTVVLCQVVGVHSEQLRVSCLGSEVEPFAPQRAGAEQVSSRRLGSAAAVGSTEGQRLQSADPDGDTDTCSFQQHSPSFHQMTSDFHFHLLTCFHFPSPALQLQYIYCPLPSIVMVLGLVLVLAVLFWQVFATCLSSPFNSLPALVFSRWFNWLLLPD